MASIKLESPKQIDLHLHAGQERDQPLETLVADFIDHGVIFLGLLDHSELYEMGDRALEKKFGQVVYHSTPQGLKDFYADVDRMSRIHAGHAQIFKGIELPEWEILAADRRAIKPADFIGCHLNTSCHDPEHRHFVRTTCGEHITKRAKELLSVCSPLGKPAVLFHPFHRRVQELRASVQAGCVGSEEVFTEEDVDFFLDNVALDHLYVELNFGDIYQAAADPEVLRLLSRTIRMLREGGVSFSLGSDYHRTPSKFLDPNELVSALGLRVEDLGLAYRLAGWIGC